jgi:hypothetical protein
MRIGLLHEPPFIAIEAVLIRRQRVEVVLPIIQPVHFILRSPSNATRLADTMRISLPHWLPSIAIEAMPEEWIEDRALCYSHDRTRAVRDR